MKLCTVCGVATSRPGSRCTEHARQSNRSRHNAVRDNADEIRQFARELGLSPSARAGLRMEPERAFDSLTADIGLPPRLRVVGDAG